MGLDLQPQVFSDPFSFIKIKVFIGFPPDAYVVHIPFQGSFFTKTLFQQKSLIPSLLMDTFGNH